MRQILLSFLIDGTAMIQVFTVKRDDSVIKVSDLTQVALPLFQLSGMHVCIPLVPMVYGFESLEGDLFTRAALRLYGNSDINSDSKATDVSQRSMALRSDGCSLPRR